MSNNEYALEKNFVIYLCGKLITAGASFLSIGLFINLFGEKDYGGYILYFTSFLICLAGSTGWLMQGILRFYSLENNKHRFKQEVDILSVNSTIIFSFILAGILLWSSADFLTIILAIISLYFAVQFSVQSTILQAEIKSLKVIVSDIIRVVIYVTLPIATHYFIPSIKPIYCLFSGLLLGFLIATIYLSGFKFPTKFSFKHKSRWSTIFLKYGLPLSLWMVFAPTTNGVDRYVIEYSLGVVALAEYTALYDIIFKLFSQMSVPFTRIVQPILVQNYNLGNIEVYKKTMLKSGLYLLLMFMIFFLGLFLIKDFIIKDYLGFKLDVYNQLNLIVIPLSISAFFWQVAILLQKDLENKNKTLMMAVFILITVILSLIANLLLIPIYGYVASAYVLLCSSVLYLLLIFLYITKLNRV